MRPSLLLPAVILLVGASALQAAPVSFRNEVMAVFSKAGCNQGACHGNQNGKGGFKLSLRGEDPDFDFNSLTREGLARRADPLQPENSLVLQKAIAAMPHEGGRRFAPDSPEYGLLSRWIRDGMPRDSDDAPKLLRLEVAPAETVLLAPEERVSLQVKAAFTDGSVRDVSRLAVYDVADLSATVSAAGEVRRQQDGETTIIVRYLDWQTAVRVAFVPERPGYVWKDVPENNFIDKHVFAKLRSLRLLPSDLCSDNVFVRRAYLDTLGLLPTAAEVRRFLDDDKADKRVRLIDALLERPEFADFWALKWSDLLRNEEKLLDKKGVQVFHSWIRQAMNEGRPLNEFARELISARGSTYGEPAANFYRALRDPQARAEAVAQVFLGVRLQCARCHNHPFDRWTQNDYHSLAAFFARVQYRVLDNTRKDRLDKHEFIGEQIVLQDREGEVTHPRTGQMLTPLLPGTSTLVKGETDRLQALADWVAAADNPFFARAQANRVWFHLIGRGIVDPNDDFRASNPPVNAPLLDALARDLAAHRFDLRHLVRTVMNSRTYQLSSEPNDTNDGDETNFSHGQVRPLQAEQLLDALAQVSDVPVSYPNQPPGTRAGQLPSPRADRRQGVSEAERFLSAFGKPDRLLTCECERSDDTTLTQAFQMVSGGLVNKMLSQSDNRLGKLLESDRSDGAIVEELFLTALSRRPSDKERTASLAMLSPTRDRRAALEDLTWALINAKEFLLRQ